MYRFAYRLKIIYADENWEYMQHIVVHNVAKLNELKKEIEKDYIYWIENIEVEVIKYTDEEELENKVRQMWKFYRTRLDFEDWGDRSGDQSWIVRRKKNKSPPWEEFYND